MRTFWPSFHIFCETPGAGSGGGPAAGGNQGDRGGAAPGGGGQSRDFSDGQRGTGGGQRGQGQGQGQQQPQQSRGQKLAPDTLIETDDGRVIKYSEYLDEQRSEINRDFQGRYKRGYDALLKEAERLDALSRQHGGQRGQPQPQDDPLAGIDDGLPVDGRTLKQLVKTLSESGLTPIAKIVQQQQQQIQQLMKDLRGTGSAVGQFQEDRSAQAFQGSLTKILSNIEVKSYPGGRVDVNDPSVRELAEDLYLSYQADSWRAGEYEKMLGDRLNALYSGFRKAEQEYAKGAPERLRQSFPLTRGNARPEGNKRYQFESPRDIVAKARAGGMWGQQHTT